MRRPSKSVYSAICKIQVHSFQTLLEDLATLCRNTVRVKTTDATFTDFTIPTPVQDKAFMLLGISPVM